MDEPFIGLDPVNVALLKEAFLEMRDRGKTLDLQHPPDGDGRGAVRVGGHHRPRPGRASHGSVRDVKRAMGRRVVRLATDGDGNGAAWLRHAARRQR